MQQIQYAILCFLCLQKKQGLCEKVAVGLGGNHYPTKFNKILLESEYGLGSIAAKHDLPYLDNSMIVQMIHKNVEKVTCAIVDAKGLGKEKSRILTAMEEVGIEVVKI